MRLHLELPFLCILSPICLLILGVLSENGKYGLSARHLPVNIRIIVTAIYLAVSLPTKNWEEGWIIWVTAAVLFPEVIAVTKTISHEK